MASFTVDVSDFVEKTKRDIDEVIKFTSFELFKSIVDDTPVDTGRLKANWFLTRNTPSIRISNATDKDGTATLAKLQKGIFQGDAERFYLTNNLPYAYRIEFEGYSRQKAPQGMVRKNIIRLNSILEQQARKVNK